MRKMLCLALSATGAILSPAAAESNLRVMVKADGLAEILINSELCRYQIDQERLENYYSEAGLNTPETLSFITSMVENARLSEDGPISQSECTISKATAKKIGILIP